ncbi:helix-turn-helix domain-containing protein [Bifidobacterium simiiventris]|uniref:helix-turn-helix domain-containing protein n=1 Tax=Bifidobacterium simiiventris TaxID=2834434 RepID=UPI001C59F3A5|nr:helix-turn-helix transcriptional regulator [Bifidobacterium simiiventris]MBW3077728.1 helix-turn-helix transcriptional regulator [Bifidobacterium simiiventris]
MKQKLLEQKHLGIAIKQVLAEVGMTQIALADRSGIPRNTLNRKINVGIFNFDELRRIACAVNRPLSSIVASAERLDSAGELVGIAGPEHEEVQR